MPKLSGGEALVKSLLAHGVDTLFALPGVQNDHFFNALYDEQQNSPEACIRVIHPRHEQGAGYMALGYSASSGRVGAFSVVPGPGLLNAASALATGYSLNTKMLCLTGQIRSDQIGRGFGMLHEIPHQLETIRSLSKWAERILHPADVPVLVAEAFKQMNTGRPRPVGLEIPPDVLAQRTEVNISVSKQEKHRPPLDLEAIEQAAQLLGQAQQPMIFVGSGAIEAAEEVRHLAEMLQAPVVAGSSGLGILSRRHPLSLTQAEAYLLWKQVDVVLTVGSRMQRPRQGWGWDEDLKLIQIDIDPLEHVRFNAPDVSLVNDSQMALQTLLPVLEKYNPVRADKSADMADLRAEMSTRLAYLEPQMAYLKLLREELPEDGFLVGELTQVGYLIRYGFPVYRPRSYISLGYQGSLGGGFAIALGVKVAHPDKPVLSVAGDGGFMFTMPELATAVQHKIATVTLVFNDGAFGNVRRMQKNDHAGRLIATDLRNPDFVKLAESFGAQGLRAENETALRQAIQKGLAYTEGPTLIEVSVGEMPDPWPVLFPKRLR